MIVLAIALLVAQAQPPARDTRPAAAVATGSIAGVVVADDDQAHPLRRARVMLNGQALDMGRSVITADDGSFAFDRVPPGRFTLGAAKDGYVSLSYGSLRPGRPGHGIQIVERQSVRVTLRLPRGAVITGTVIDVDGLPAQGIAVTALVRRYIGEQGEARYLATGPAASALSDDRGTYRIYGLPAGEYLVTAQPPPRQAGLTTAEVRTLSRGAIGDRSLVMSQVFHPGTTDVGRASRVTVVAGEERGGTDIQLQYVPLATVSGSVTAANGWNPAMLTIARADDVPGFDRVSYVRADQDGRFTFTSVQPGRYRIVARSTPVSPVTTSGSPLIVVAGNTQVAFADVAVDGDDVSNVALTFEPLFTIAGHLVFEGERPPPLAPLRAAAPLSMAVANAGPSIPQIQLESDGTFKVEGIVPGAYRLSGNLQGLRTPIGSWWLKSLAIGGREMLDAPLDLRQGAGDAVMTLSDRASEITGIVKDSQGYPAPETVVVAFTADRSAWFFNSRRVAGVRPDRQGRYAIRNLPPGEYRLIAVTDLDQGEWFDPSVLERLLPAATPVIVSATETKLRDLVVR